MYDEPGIGLAAPQVGEAIRLIVVDTEWTEDDAERNPLVLVNPEIIESEGGVTWTEGCLSVPDFQADVERAEHVTLAATDLDGKPVEIRASELQAVCFQHEIDHLDGILFIDRISRLKREMYVRKRKKQLRQEQLEAG
jgi:peptide deformylase